MEYKNTVLDEKMYCGKTKSGMRYFILPKKGFNFKSAAVVVNYGSKDIFRGSPLGTAHFIEHRLFENEDGNAFDDFVKNNAEANAFTDFNKTAYYFNTADNFYENLEILTDFVSRPFFEKDSVERERDIIKQEITMYGDDPYWQTYFDCIGKMYPQSDLKEIAGETETVEKIDKEMLDICYDRFYRAENMALICCGDIDKERVLDIAEKMDIKKGYEGIKKEPLEIEGGEETVREMGLSVPVFSFGLPLKYDERCNSLWAKYRIKVLMDIIAGNASRVYNNLYNSGIVKEPIGFDYICGEGYGAIVFTGQSKEYKRAAGVIKDFLVQAKKVGISSRDFENCRKKACGRFIRGFNSINALCMAQVDIFDKGNLLQVYEGLSNMTKFELDMILNNYIDIDKAVLSAAQ